MSLAEQGGSFISNFLDIDSDPDLISDPDLESDLEPERASGDSNMAHQVGPTDAHAHTAATAAMDNTKHRPTKIEVRSQKLQRQQPRSQNQSGRGTSCNQRRGSMRITEHDA